MGKRKKSSRKPVGPKKKEPLAKTFACLFCNHEHAIIVQLDKKLGLGQLFCKVCGQKFQTGINYLSAPVDVYSDWIDACDNVAKDGVDPEELGMSSGRRDSAAGNAIVEDGEDEDADAEYGEEVV